MVSANISPTNLRKSYDLYFQFFHRKADYLLLQQRDNIAALSSIVLLKTEFENCRSNIIDPEIRRKVAKATLTAKKLASNLNGTDSSQLASSLFDWFSKEFSSEVRDLPIMNRR